MRRISVPRKATVAVTTAAALAAIGGVSVAVGAIPNSDGNIYACVNDGNGTVRVQQDPAQPCKRNWSPLNWQQTAPTPRAYVAFERSRVAGTVAGEDNNVGFLEVACDEGDIATGGGYSAGDGISFTRSASTTGARGWMVTARNTNEFSREVSVLVNCLDTA